MTEFRTDRSELLDALSIAGAVARKVKSIPSLAAALLDAGSDQRLLLGASDLEVGLTIELKCHTVAPGRLGVNAAELLELIQSTAEETVHFVAQGGPRVTVKCGAHVQDLTTVDPATFPSFPLSPDRSEQPVAEIDISGSELAAMIARTIFATSHEEKRPDMWGVQMETPEPGLLRFVATDGHRLAIAESRLPSLEVVRPALVPPKALQIVRALARSAPEMIAHLTLSEFGLTIKYGTSRLQTRLLAFELPDYRPVLNSSFQHQFSVNRDELLKVIDLIITTGDSRARDVALLKARIERESTERTLKRFERERQKLHHIAVMILATGTLTMMLPMLTVEGRQPLNETLAMTVLDTDYEGESIGIHVRAKYVREGLQAVPEGTDVSVHFNGPDKPLMMTSNLDCTFRYVLMPIR